jgi:hypothetical protein
MPDRCRIDRMKQHEQPDLNGVYETSIGDMSLRRVPVRDDSQRTEDKRSNENTSRASCRVARHSVCPMKANSATTGK